jgi:hypothetical protein
VEAWYGWTRTRNTPVSREVRSGWIENPGEAFIKHLHESIVQGKMAMRFVIHRRQGGRLRNERQRQEPDCGEPSGFNFHEFPSLALKL